jgi:GT2 family glycosyltransferase
MSAVRLTIGITTRNRPEALRRCLESLAKLSALSPEVLVFDDASTHAVASSISGWNLAGRVRILRDDRGPGYVVGRNRLVREAAAPCVLLMDDDAAVFDPAAIAQALRVLESDRLAGAVAFAACDVAGKRWDDAMQPARGRTACLVPAFIGFAHLVRKEVFVGCGGYRESFVFYGEEKDFCLRLIEAGFKIVYLPEALVVHQPDPAGRSQQRYLRYVTRNDSLAALYNEPLSRLVWLLPARFSLYFRMRRAWHVRDPWGWLWILRELWAQREGVWRDRAPVSRATIATWQRLRQSPEAYELQQCPD